jgi:hypothetical protein
MCGSGHCPSTLTDKAMAGMNLTARKEYEEVQRAALLQRHQSMMPSRALALAPGSAGVMRPSTGVDNSTTAAAHTPGTARSSYLRTHASFGPRVSALTTNVHPSIERVVAALQHLSRP